MSIETAKPWPSQTTEVIGLLVWFVVCFTAAFLTSSSGPDTWYRELNQPIITPPDWIFAPVWTVLYAMMSVAAWLVWKSGGLEKTKWALQVFLVQLALNAAWSWLFFGRHRIDLALIDIVALGTTIALTVYLFSKHSRVAASLMLPYLAWVSFATILNAAFWWQNG